ncbi:acyl carrier protein [bacterium]|nr:acyl carrier protein [bacterium]
MDDLLYRQARRLVCETLEVSEEVLQDSTLFVDDLGIDSILIIELKTRFEEQYGITIDKEILKDLNCLTDILEYLDSRNIQAVAPVKQ